MAATLPAAAGALSRVSPVPGSSTAQQNQVHFSIRSKFRMLTIRRSGSQSQPQEKAVGTESSQEQEAVPELQKGKTEGGEGEEQEQKQVDGGALKELRSESSSDSSDLWAGLVQEIGLIEWPDFGRVFGTTVVVLGIIFGSSIVLLTVNFLLAQLSDLVFQVQSSG